MAEGFEEFDEKFARGFAAAFAEVSVVLDERAAGVKLTGVGVVSSTAEKYSGKVQQQSHSSAMRRVP